MGMSFSPMYQPVTSSTIKADGDMDISPYDLLCTDVYADTVEATEFVGGVGNFESVLCPMLKYSGNIVFSGTDSITTIPSISKNVLGPEFLSDGAILGVIPFPKTAGVINIEDSIYPDTVSIPFTFQRTVSRSDTSVMALYRGDELYQKITIPVGASNTTVIISIPYWDNSIWSVRHVSGYVSDINYTYGATTSTISLYAG